MSSLILTTCDSGAGHLKQARAADRILTFTHRLVTGPIPGDGASEAFFRERQSLYKAEGLFHEPWWFEVEDIEGTDPHFKQVWSRLPEVCLQYDQITLWIDPDANAQLVLVQLLDWLGQVPELASRLWLKLSESPLGERRPGDWVLPPRRVEPADVALASRAWTAFRAPTPQAWAALGNDESVRRLPGLYRAIELMLNELPDRTGLGATERRLLRLTERQAWWDEAARGGNDTPRPALPAAERGPEQILRRVIHQSERLPLGHLEVGEALCDLAAAPVPALAGVTERRYSLDMHLDSERFQRFRESPISLTDLGRRLVAGTDDWLRHNPVHRWWGGTRLANDSLWRWDPANRHLSSPT